MKLDCRQAADAWAMTAHGLLGTNIDDLCQLYLFQRDCRLKALIVELRRKERTTVKTRISARRRLRKPLIGHA